MINYRQRRRRRSGYALRVAGEMKSGMEDRFLNSLRMVHPPKMAEWTITIVPQSGIWAGHPHVFEISISEEYPIRPPKVRCLTSVWHPNIDLEGAVCLNILRDDWKPNLGLNIIFLGLEFLFQSPNANDPLNKVASLEMDSNPSSFAAHVREYMRRGARS